MPETDPFGPDSDDTKSEETGRLSATVGGRDKVVVTLKGGAGYAAPWIVIHADGVEDALSYFNEQGSDLKTLMERVQAAAAKFSGEATSSAPSPERKSGPPPSAKKHPGGRREYCQHGEMNYATGFSQKKADKSKDGNGTWQAFDCPENQCDRKWI